MRNNRGTVLIDYLLTLLIVVMMIPVIILSISIISHALKQPYCLQDLVATYQLRRILVLSYSPHIEEDALYFTYKKKEMKLSLINENIILTPGTQIFYIDVDTCLFYEENHVIYVQYEREEDAYTEAIAKY